MSFPRDPAGLRRVWEVETARGWARGGLLTPAQLQAVEAAGAPAPALAGWPVRLLLFGLAAVAVAAVCYFMTAGGEYWGLPLVLAGAACWFAGERLAAGFALHRFGAEECLMLAGPLLAGLGVGGALGLAGSRAPSLPEAAAGAAAALGYAALYARERHLGAALGVAVSAAALVHSFAPSHARPALTLAWAALLAAAAARPAVPDYEGEGWDAALALLALLVPIACNHKLDSPFSASGRGAGLEYWGSYAFCWLWPAAVLAWGVRRRSRPLLASGALGLLLAVYTNKPYWGLRREDWDPAALGGAFLIFAVALERWLRAGPGGGRAGFIADPLAAPREHGLGGAAALLAAAAPHGGGPAPDAPPSGLGGGTSGGAGAGDAF